MAYFSVNDFLGQVRGNGLVFSNRFEIQLKSPVGNDRTPSMLVEEATIPSCKRCGHQQRLACGQKTECMV